MSLQPTLFDGDRMTLVEAIEHTALILNAYREDYDHWAIAFSGGKDSAAVVAAVCWLVRTGRVRAPKSLTVLTGDTRMELPPLWTTAQQILAEVRQFGHSARIVLPAMDDRFFVYMLGRGVPPPSNTFRWCTAQLKIEPMERALWDLGVALGYGEIRPNERGRLQYIGNGTGKVLMLTGVRQGEGPLTFEARLWALEQALDIQARAGVDLINPEEEARIRELIAAGQWPNGWDGTEPLASLPFENVNPDGSVQPEFALLESEVRA